MNIMFTKDATFGSDSVASSVTTGSIELCSVGSNRGEGDQVIPIKLGNAVIAPLVTVKSATTRNKRGTTSALIKVSMPYTAFGTKKSYVEGELGSQTINSSLVQDPSRTGGELSFHIVLAIPSAMTTDMNRTDDGTGDAKLIREAAYQQLSALAMLLSYVAGPHLMPGSPTLGHWSVSGGVNKYSTDIAGNPGITIRRVAAGLKAGDNFTDKVREVKGQTYFDTKIVGADGTDYGAGINAARVEVPVLLHNALGRIVRGQPALACDDIAPETQVG